MKLLKKYAFQIAALLGLVLAGIFAPLIDAHTLTPVSHASSPVWTPGCVTKGEYRAVDDGWTKRRVQRRFDTVGKLYTLNSSTMSKKYERCSTDKYDITVWYKKKDGVWRVTAKAVN